MADADLPTPTDNLADAIMVLRCVSPREMAEACVRQGYVPKGDLDGSMIDGLREILDERTHDCRPHAVLCHTPEGGVAPKCGRCDRFLPAE